MIKTFIFITLIATTSVFIQAQSDPDAKAVQSYRLTMPVLQKITAANRAFVAALKNDPAAQKQLEADDAKNDDDQQSLAAMEKKLVAMPHMANALKGAGLSAHEYATFEMCTLQAGLATNLPAGASLPAGLQAANVQFVRDHKKDIEQMNGALQGQ